MMDDEKEPVQEPVEDARLKDRRPPYGEGEAKRKRGDE